jgi:hypothetical protein
MSSRPCRRKRRRKPMSGRNDEIGICRSMAVVVAAATTAIVPTAMDIEDPVIRRLGMAVYPLTAMAGAGKIEATVIEDLKNDVTAIETVTGTGSGIEIVTVTANELLAVVEIKTTGGAVAATRVGVTDPVDGRQSGITKAIGHLEGMIPDPIEMDIGIRIGIVGPTIRGPLFS